MTIQDEFSSLIYNFLEEKKKVTYLKKYAVDFQRFGGIVSKMTVSLTFSSVNMRDTILSDMFDVCNSFLREKTEGRLAFVPLVVDKQRICVSMEDIPEMERALMWEAYNTSGQYVPREDYYNYFKLEMKQKKGVL